MNGVLLVDKPAGMTSHDVVDRVRRAAQQRRIGHTGTLDPGATGLLVLCLGAATRLSEHLTGLDKTYEGTMRLGVVTDSYDMDGAAVSEHPVPALAQADIQAVCDTLTGDILQTPPMMSAVKVGGKRLYKMARSGQTVEREPRPVHVEAFDILSWTPPEAGLLVRCGSGTYVRALCHEAGQALGCGGILASLRRTRVGAFSVADAVALDALDGPDTVRGRLIPMEDALDLPVVRVDRARAAMILTGAAIATSIRPAPEDFPDGLVQIKSEDGRLLALGTVVATETGALVRPRRVFMPEQ